jgi:DNA-directed RNA polymerase subunit RPC12/RpoP
MMQFKCGECGKTNLFYQGHEPSHCSSCGKEVHLKDPKPTGFSPEETKALALFMEENSPLDGTWEAIHMDVKEGEDPEGVIDHYRNDPLFKLYWRLTGGDMERWLSDAKMNAIELRDENPPENRITIVTMYRACDAETFTAAVKGEIPEEDRQEMSTRFGMAGDDGLPDNMFFCEFDVVESVKDLKRMLNVGTDGDVVNKEWLREHGEDKEQLACRKCGSPINSRGRCVDETCPYSDRGQNEEYTEG